MTWQQLVGICLGTAAILGTAYGLARLARDLISGMRRLSRMLDDWLGEPEHPGMPGTGRPGVIARLASVEEKLLVVSRLERRVENVEEQLKTISAVSQSDGSVSLDALVERAADAGPVMRYGF